MEFLLCSKQAEVKVNANKSSEDSSQSILRKRQCNIAPKSKGWRRIGLLCASLLKAA